MEKSEKLTDIIDETMSELSKHDYRKSYVGHHGLVFNAVRTFCAESKTEQYSEKIGQDFLIWIKVQKPYLKHHTMNEYRMAVCRLDSTLNGTEWCPLGKKLMSYEKSCYDNLVNSYEKHLHNKGKKKWVVRAHIHFIARFLKFIEDQGVFNLRELAPNHIFEAFKASTQKYTFKNVIGAFLRYAYNYKLINVNLSIIVPGMPCNTPVPTVYSPEEVEMLIASIDRSTELGKRNYANVLLAARLGLRASDIAELKFKCLHVETQTIKIVQSKTKQPLVLPLLPDVKNAIDDYMNNARPTSDDEHIFLNLRGYGSLLPATVASSIRRIFEMSEVDCGGRKHGSHALRSSLASAMLAEGNDYPTIQKVLGHKDIQSAKSYVKADVEQLRSNALPVPQLTTNYERLLAAVGAAV